ncbi:MAG: S8 family serine peptidase [Bacteroidales bacterium]
MNQKLFLSLIILLFSLFLKGNNPVMVWVEFKDKQHSPYSLTRPHEFLSTRAIERRQKQNIPFDHFDLPVSPLYIETLAADTSITVFYTSRWLNGALLKISNNDFLQNLDEIDFILSWQDVKPVPTSPEKSENFGSNGSQQHQWYMSLHEEAFDKFPYSLNHYYSGYPEYGSSEDQISLVNGQALHWPGYWGEGKIVAVFDSGFRSVDTLEAFSYLWNNNKILGFRDFVEPGSNIFDTHTHGTYVLSVMGGYLSGNLSGSALGASYWLLRTEDVSSEFRIEEYNWLAGAEFADSVGADIINSSLGYTRFDNTIQDYFYDDLDGQTTIVARAANKAFSKGLLVVNSAGNYGSQSWMYVGSPADAHGALAVGGTNSVGTRVAFSSLGPTADGRVKPDIMAQAQGVAVANIMGSVGQANGTSFSSPLIAGMAACLWQKYPAANNEEIRNAIIRSADRYLLPDTIYGFGIPDFGKAIDILDGKFEGTRMAYLISNPLLPNSAVRFYAEENEEFISIDLINSNGQKIWTITDLNVFYGINEVRPFANINTLNSGIYIIRINFKNRSENIKAIKL